MSLAGTIYFIQSGHNGLNAFATQLFLIANIHYWFWIVHANDTACFLLDVQGSVPWLVDVFSRKILELSYIGLDVLAIHVHLLTYPTWVVALNLVTEEPTASTLHPAHRRERLLKVQHKLLEELLAQYPGQPHVTSCQKDSNTLTPQEVCPTFLTALADDCIDPWEAGLTLSPCFKILWVIIPRKLNAHWVAFHLIKVRSEVSHNKGKLSKKKVFGQLLKQSMALLRCGSKLPELAEQLPHRETSKPNIGTERVLVHQPFNRVI